MTTDTAMLVCKIVLEGSCGGGWGEGDGTLSLSLSLSVCVCADGVALEKIPYVDHPDIRTVSQSVKSPTQPLPHTTHVLCVASSLPPSHTQGAHDSTNMPFRYVALSHRSKRAADASEKGSRAKRPGCDALCVCVCVCVAWLSLAAQIRPFCRGEWLSCCARVLTTT